MTRFPLGLWPGSDNTAGIPPYAGFDGNDQFTKLLTHFTHGSPTGWDFSVPNRGRATAFGSAAHSGARSKWLASSLLLNGTTDYLQFPDSADWNFGSGDFTIDTWIYTAGAPGVHHTIYCQNKDASFTQMLALYVLSTGQLFFELRDGSTTNLASAQSAAGTVAAATWTHVALERSGNTWTLYKDGAAVASTVYAGAVPDIAAPITIGNLEYAGWTLNGNLDELRVSKGVARYKGLAFTPPTGPYQYERIHGNDKYTKLLLHMSPFAGQTSFRDYSPSIGASLLLDYLIIGGGGGGAHPGAGGAGGFLTGTMTVAGSSFSVVVGGGGSSLGNFTAGTAGSGGPSSFGGVTALGGGGGGGYGANSGGNGGSGGGAGHNGVSGGSPGTGTVGQGKNGGSSSGTGAGGQMAGGAGGGAGAVGGNGVYPNGGVGGIGLTSSISGSAVNYAGGGSANSTDPGYGGGRDSVAGVANTGGGGGARAVGGSGIVIIRYPGAQQAVGGTVTSVAGWTIHTFTANGTFVLSGGQNNKGAATVVGNTVLSTAQMVFGGTSALFDGTGDYLTFADSTDWTADTDWTVDCWIRLAALPASGLSSSIVSQSDAPFTILWMFMINENGNLQFLLRQAGSDTYVNTFNGDIAINQWYHVALVRSGTTFMIFRNGVLRGSTVCPVPVDIAAPLEIGGLNGPNYNFNGYIDELRISKGVARWTGNFDPPRAPYGVGGNDGFTKLLVHGDAALASTTLDSSPFARSGHTQSGITLNTNSVWGGSSYSAAGAGNLTFPNHADYQFGAGDFTVDCWVYPTALAVACVWTTGTDANNRFGFFLSSDGSAFLQAYIAATVTLTVSTAVGVFAANQWCHIACVRRGNDWTIYKNGIAVGALNVSYTIPAFTGALVLFAQHGGSNPLAAQIEEFRVSKGIARWTGPFVPPLIPYFGVTAHSTDL